MEFDLIDPTGGYRSATRWKIGESPSLILLDLVDFICHGLTLAKMGSGLMKGLRLMQLKETSKEIRKC